MTNRIDYFSFWQPAIFTPSNNPGTSFLAKCGWVIGSFADQYASLKQIAWDIDAERMDAHKIYFEGEEKKVPVWQTALKVGAYVLPLLLSPALILLPVLALTIKYFFKRHLNECLALTKKSPNEIIAEKQFGNSKIVLLFGSITDETTDAIVNAANENLLAGGGVCGAIHQTAGIAPFHECKEILKKQNRHKLDIGEAVLTSAGELKGKGIKAIVHAVGPDYRVKEEEEKGTELLKAAYRNSLELAYNSEGKKDFSSTGVKDQTLRSIAFPSISTGIFKAPLGEAASIALGTAKEFIEEHPDAFEEIRFVFLPLDHDPKTALVFQEAFENL